MYVISDYYSLVILQTNLVNVVKDFDLPCSLIPSPLYHILVSGTLVPLDSDVTET